MKKKIKDVTIGELLNTCDKYENALDCNCKCPFRKFCIEYISSCVNYEYLESEVEL